MFHGGRQLYCLNARKSANVGFAELHLAPDGTTLGPSNSQEATMTRGNDEELHRPSIESGQMPLGSGASPSKQWRAGPHDQRFSAGPGPVCSIRPALMREPDSRLPPFRWVRRALARGIVGLSAAILGIAPALADRNTAPKDAEAYIIWPSDGTVVEGGKLWVRMGLRNMGVSPKGVHMPNVGPITC
jgi:hypothetical protein